MLNTTEKFLKTYRLLGFGITKGGEEPRIDTKNYSLAGKKASKVRLNINHATKQGVTVHEYCPLKARNEELENKFHAISRSWLSMKKSNELIFTMGTLGLENPMDRRYFYATSITGEVEGFIVFVPFDGMNGYMADVTRYRVNATRGVMEMMINEAVKTFAKEDIQWLSLAAAPLARLEDETQTTAKVLNLIYKKMNGIYGFQNLYQTKLKYNPNVWEKSYYVYYPPMFKPGFAYAVARIQNPKGLWDYLKFFVRNKHSSSEKE